MLTSISSLPPRATLMNPRVASARVVGATASILLLRHHQQTREFRFGWWNDRLDRDQQREFRRRYRALRHKYTDAVDRKLPWEYYGGSSRSSRPSVNHYWHSKRCFGLGRHGGKHSYRSTDAEPGARPGRNIEDVERGVWDSLLFGGKEAEQSTSSKQQDQWVSPFDDIRDYIARRQAEFLGEDEVTPKPSETHFSRKTRKTAQKAAQSEEDYVIDPITNRKVSKASSKSSPAESADAPAPYFTHDTDLPPTPAELRAYDNVVIDDIIDDIVSSESVAKSAADSTASNARAPVLESEAYVREHQPDLSAISDSNEASYMSWKYKGMFWGEDTPSKQEAAELEKYKPILDEIVDITSAATPEYDDLHKYKPVMHKELDGKPQANAEQEAYPDLHLYKPFAYNEPHGQVVEQVETACDPEELAKYQPFKWNEPHGQPLGQAVEHVCDPAELAKYQPFMWNEPHGQATVSGAELGHESYDPAELAKYQPFMYNEPHGQSPSAAAVELGHEGHDQSEVQRYQPFWHSELDNRAATTSFPVNSEELSAYGAVRYQEPHGKSEAVVDPVAESLKEYETKAESAETSEEIYAKVLRRLEQFTPFETGESATTATSPQADPRPAVSGLSDDKALEWDRLETSMERMNADADTIDRAASIAVKKYKARTDSINTAHREQALVDPYSTEPQGLETSYAEECQGQTNEPMYVKVHTRVNKEEAPVEAVVETSAVASSPESEPASYKILAYDPTMQTINVAETSSAVPETASPLTPGEALLRLSNPTKFFQHFKPLQEQGYEIVSGGGDVLIFRKVRSAQPASQQSTAKTTAADDILTSAVNPIDRTGDQYVSPSAANFASPTGYVNLDLPPLQDNTTVSAATASDLPPPPAETIAAPAPKFKSNIDVRREEPVFSGPKIHRSRESAKPGVAKRMLVGATWVAGISYVLGVVSEFIKAQ